MKRLYVHPDNVAPLCSHCHYGLDHSELDVLPYLTLDEQLHVVKTLGGIESARRRLAPTDYDRRIEQARRDALLEAA